MLPSQIRPPAAIGGQSRSMFDFTRFDDGDIAEQAAVGNNSRGTAGDAQKAQKSLVYDPDSCVEFLPRLLTSAEIVGSPDLHRSPRIAALNPKLRADCTTHHRDDGGFW